MRFARLAFMVALGLVGGTARAAEVPDALEATWRATSTSRASIDERIEQTVAQMSWIKRPFVRSKLKESTPVCRRLRIWETPDGQVATQCDGEKVVVAPADGARTPWTTPDGDDFTLTHELRGQRLVQTFFGPKGTKETVFRLDGDRLRLDVRIRSRHLPEDVTYSMEFQA